MKKITLIAANPFGVFANLFWILRHLRFAEIEGRIPIVHWVGGIYWQKNGKYNGVKSPNIWDYFFEPVSEYPSSMFKIKQKNYGAFAIKSDEGWLRVDDPPKLATVGSETFDIKIVRKPPKNILGEPESCWDVGLPPKACIHNPSQEIREYVGGLLSKHVRLRQVVLDKIDSFYEKHMKGFHVLGIHRHAGIDMAAGHGHTKRFDKKISQYLELHPDAKIFVASDTHVEVNHIKKRFGDRVVACDVLRAKKGRWLFNAKNRRWVDSRLRKQMPLVGAGPAEEVLIEVMLLSRCNCLYYGMSNVSSAATFFNPDMPATFIPKFTKEQRKKLGFDY